ncbi:energy transducer TonB [Pseudomonas sp. CFBP 13710]|uniref:energy transducer TonB n=1 Tax=Pseudomonas sp. CFBP 13710 TaxID=2775311 RepID=UPI00178486E1|nr:energy transducer TonB [Pseudomonas sp. CFBP 13710]MBD8731268.1 energy transducer TonB [Pseudomonas sp. CFBP 13710]
MSVINSTAPGYISPIGDFSQHNIQTLGAASALWQDFFAQALTEHCDGQLPGQARAAADNTAAAEPSAGSEILAHILLQRLCDVRDTEVKPPEPLFLPKAELELTLLDKPSAPLPEQDVLAQQAQLAFDSRWVRPLVLNQGGQSTQPAPAPLPRAMRLPIAELDWQLAQTPVPLAQETISEQCHALDLDLSWMRPAVLNNIRLAA